MGQRHINKQKAVFHDQKHSHDDHVEKTRDVQDFSSTSTSRVIPIVDLQNMNEENIEKFIPKEVLMEMCINYLEIGEMFKLALTCKMLYLYLLCGGGDEEELWKGFAKRDGIQVQDGTCKQTYKKIFENIQNLLQSKDFDKTQYVYQLIISPSSIFFTENFIPKFNLNELVYILRNTKINIMVRANIIMRGLAKFPVNEDYLEKLKIIFLNACALEDGKRFTFIESNYSSQFTILVILFKYRFYELGKNTPLIENLMFSKFLYRLDFSGMQTKDSLIYRAINIMLKDYNKKTTLNSDQIFDLCHFYWNLVAQDKIGNIQAIEMFNIFQSFSESRREQVLETILKLLNNHTEHFDNNTFSKTVSAFIIEYLTLSDVVMDQVIKYSNQYNHYCYGYYERLIKSKELSTSTKQLAVDYLFQIFNKQKYERPLQFRSPYFYYTFDLIWNNRFILNEKQRLYFENELENEMFNTWADCKQVPPPKYTSMLSNVDLKRTVDNLLISEPLTFIIESCYLAEEKGNAAFEVFEQYSNEISQDSDIEKFFSKLIPLLEIIFGHQNNNDDITDRMIFRIIRWMKLKYLKGAETMMKYIKNQSYYVPLFECVK